MLRSRREMGEVKEKPDERLRLILQPLDPDSAYATDPAIAEEPLDTSVGLLVGLALLGTLIYLVSRGR